MRRLGFPHKGLVPYQPSLQLKESLANSRFLNDELSECTKDTPKTQNAPAGIRTQMASLEGWDPSH